VKRLPASIRQSGLTLIELLVAMVVGLLITLAATGVLLVARNGFRTVDAASQLRDNARFAASLIQRLAVQAGFKDVGDAATQRLNVKSLSSDPEPQVFGFDNAIARRDTLDAATRRTSPNKMAWGSDVLILRYQPMETFPGSGVVDGSLVDCAGYASNAIAQNRDDTRVSVLYVDESPSDGNEPALMCIRSTTGLPPLDRAQPLVRGVESFHVLYGVDGVGAGAKASTATSVPDRYVRADQLTVKGDVAATHANWRRVRSLRIGMILRSEGGAAQDKAATTLYPLGPAFASSGDAGTTFTAPADGRVRQVVNFTVHLRNDQGL
jgi:type IV pilus assembly protein PilW